MCSPEPRPLSAQSAIGSVLSWNQEAEDALIGAVLLTNTVLPALINEEGVRPQHFFLESHRLIWQAVMDMHTQGIHVDPITLTAHMKASGTFKDLPKGRADIDALTLGVPGVGGVRQYARIVIEAWVWRMRLRAVYELNDAIADQDEAAFAKACARLSDPRVKPSVEVDRPTLRSVA